MAIEHFPKAKYTYQFSFEKLEFMRAKLVKLVVQFLLVVGHYDWPNVAPYECAANARH